MNTISPPPPPPHTHYTFTEKFWHLLHARTHTHTHTHTHLFLTFNPPPTPSPLPLQDDNSILSKQVNHIANRLSHSTFVAGSSNGNDLHSNRKRARTFLAIYLWRKILWPELPELTQPAVILQSTYLAALLEKLRNLWDTGVAFRNRVPPSCQRNLCFCCCCF